MTRQPAARAPVGRSVAELADAADLRSAVATSLSAAPINELTLHRNVWLLVGVERDAGASPSHVIATLTDLVDEAAEAAVTPVCVREARLRQLILWCVESYFRHLGDGGLPRELSEGPSLPRPASNR